MKAGRGFLAVVAVLTAGAIGAPLAHAGSYDVLSCTVGGTLSSNNAWAAANNPAGDGRYVTDATCPSLNDPLTTKLAGASSFGNGTYSGLWFFAPPDTAITNYSMTVHHYWYAPGNGAPDETTYTALTLGPTLVGGTGQFDGPTQQNLANEGHWYGFRSAGSSGAADTGVLTRTLSDSTAAKTQRTATYMTVSAGCYNTAGCTLRPTATVFLELYGSRVTITDSTAPALPGPTAGAGLLEPGTRSGDEPVTFSAADNVGIRRAELVDVTDAANPSVVAAEDYNSTATVQNTRCSFTKPRPCPDLNNQTLAPSPAIAGQRTLLVRVTDAAGNQTVSTPFAVTARGPVNGVGGGDGSRLVAGFPGHTFRGRGKARRKVGVLRPTQTVGWGHGVPVRGILRNAAGQPVAGAGLGLLVRELRLGARYVDRPLPPRGVTLELQAHQPGHGWRTVKTTRTRKGGVYSTRYRFNSFGGRFTFRMRLRPSDSYPYARGTSSARRVRVG